ncbi:MAG: MATE family efflux transporter [Firmicutes bacterium]|nr:MATE family efflux transporter [Bacillota bacterium]
MKIQLSDHFTYRKLMCFVLPSVLMIICTSIYSIIDGFFVSNFVGKTPFAAINLIMPVLMGVGAIGCIFGTGGSAVVSKLMGEGRRKRAIQTFSMIIYVLLGIGIFVSVLGFIFIRHVASALGAEGHLLDLCVVYARILFCSMPAFMLQFAFQSFLVAAEKPGLSLKINIVAGVANAVLDYLFIVVFPFGLAGAAIATAVGQLIGGFFPMIYFARENGSPLRLTKTKLSGHVLFDTCVNGASEMVTSLSSSIVNILYNFQLMKFAGENGVTAYGIVMYVEIIFMAVFMGYSFGSAPIVSYSYGAGNHGELKNMFRKSVCLLTISGIVLVLASETFAEPLVMIFASYDAELFAMTTRGFQLYALAFLFMGFNVWGSSFFTALNDGVVSAAISFVHTLVFQTAVIAILPVMFGMDGVWLSIVVAEILSLVVTVTFLAVKRNNYQYA